MASPKFHNSFRKYHRWLGFFLAGIMAVYATSGILLIFRTTDFLKYEQTEQRQLAPQLTGAELSKQLRIRGFAVKGETDTKIQFNQGEYRKDTGMATIVSKEYPLVLAKLVKLHKANTNSPLFFVNIFFGLSLLFFVISALLMFIPRALPYKNGLKIAAVGVIFMLLMVTFGV
jgi:hypothetical protein